MAHPYWQSIWCKIRSAKSVAGQTRSFDDAGFISGFPPKAENRWGDLSVHPMVSREACSMVEPNVRGGTPNMTAGPPFNVSDLIDTRPLGAFQVRVIVLCTFVALLDGMDLQSIGLAAAGIAADLHIPLPSLRIVFSAALAGLALGAFGFGLLADRIGRKAVLIGATAASAFSPSPRHWRRTSACWWLSGFSPGSGLAAPCRASSA
jgi:hypothetical protein